MRFKIVYRVKPGHSIPDALKSELNRRLSPSNEHDVEQFADLAGPTVPLDNRV